MEIGFLGGGKMAEALLAGLLREKVYAPAAIGVSDTNSDRLQELTNRHGVQTFPENATLADAGKTIVLAVKPQDLEVVLPNVESALAGKAVISIAAGRTIAYFASRLPGARIIRAMPNLACQAGEGMTALCAGQQATPADLEVARTLFACSGQVLTCEEQHFDWVTAISGSGPAFWAQLCAYEMDAAIQAGLPAETARLLVLQTMLGTARYLRESGTACADFMEAVASKGGTTAAGLEVLRSHPVQAALQETLAATAARSAALRGS